ncbi:MAG: hypothetical protein RBT69_01385 [Spirochaetia bacterium]|jgi:hypothetical protein|nr:hypothetical protein [Spirochaetia bacterium]
MKNIKKTVLVALAVITIPVLLFLNAWQGFRFERMNAEIRNYEYEQKEWFEENKRMLAALSVYSSPARVKKIVDEDKELNIQKPGQAIIIQFVQQQEGAAVE